MIGKIITVLRNEGIKGFIKRVRGRRDKKVVMMRLLRELRSFSNLMLLSEGFKRTTKFGYLSYRCNICGMACKSKVVELRRDEPSCLGCGSTVRMRAIIHTLSTELFGESLAIRDFPERPDIKGIGMSDWIEYAGVLEKKLGYKNTYYHKPPKLDITSIDSDIEGTLDFVISSDVFEHVEPPVSRAFENVRKLLKPDGVFIFSVPYNKDEATQEHFPDLYNYEIVETEGTCILKNITRGGVEQTYDDLVFHGGAGATLEMRRFSEASIREEFRKAGFAHVNIYSEPDFEHGVYWSNDCSLPITARIE
jgi:SAM-dependent methyltransferase